MSKLLINEHPLQVLPSLAVAIGLNEAIFLQQLHYWIENAKSPRSNTGRQVDDEWWVFNTVSDWQETNFPFWSVATINRAIKSLEKKRLIRSRFDLNKVGYDRTKWYTIDYEQLRMKNAFSHSDKMGFSQNDQMDLVKMTNTIPETTQRLPETTKERDQKPPTPPKPKKPKSPSKKKTPKEPIPPAVQIHRSIAYRYPKKVLFAMIADAVGEKPEDLKRWEETVLAYVACGWNAANVKAQLEYFERGEIPSTNGGNYEKGKGNSKGNAKIGPGGARQATGHDLNRKSTFNPYTNEIIPPRVR